MALSNLLGDLGLDGTLQKIAAYLEQLAGNIGRWYPNTAGQMPVTIASGTVTTVTTLTNQSQQSGFSTTYDQYAQCLSCAQALRSKITVS